MKHASLRLGALALSSQRLNKGLLLLAGLTLLLTSTSYWAVSRLVEAEQDKVEFHFARVIENIHEHETFLRNVASAYDRTNHSLLADVQPASTTALGSDGHRELFQGRALPLSLPFTLAYDSRLTSMETRGALSLGTQLTDYYSTYWAGSYYASPQMFVFAPNAQFDIAVPGIDGTRQRLPLRQAQYLEIAGRLREQLQPQRPLLSGTGVRWLRAPSGLYSTAKTLVASIGVDLPASIMPSRQEQGLTTVVALLDMGQINEIERLLRRPVYNQFTLISPQGEVLLGSLDDDSQAPMGLSFSGKGLRFKMSTENGARWTALYAISYQDFLRYAKWPLVGLGLTVLLALLVGWWINRWYRLQIVQPAQRAQQRLFEGEAFNRVMMDNAPVGLSVVRREDHEVLLENQRAREWQGTAELIKSLNLGDVPAAPDEVWLEVAGRHLQACFVATRYQGEDVLLCGFNDITQHVDTAQTMEEARRTADQASEAKTLFLATMSHEIRTPLYGVLGNLELLGLTDLNHRQRQYLEVIQGSSAVLFQLISDVLDVSKIESGQIALEAITFCPQDLVQEAVRGFTAAAQHKGLPIQTEIEPQVPARLRGDPGRIRQILNNLLSNAIKFTESGRVLVRLAVVEMGEARVALQWQVSDTGAGIPEKALEQLFKPFYQVSERDQSTGAGLGLSICARLSELMGGSMRVVSEPGLGSSFSLLLELPIVALQAPPLASQPQQGSRLPGKPLQILVAEDNPINQAILQEQLQALGAQATVTENGERALQAWAAQAFDLVITDVNMPRMNGYELTRELRRIGATVPIIGVTANAMREEGERCLQVGMNAWVVKPLSLSMLRATVLAHCSEVQGGGLAVDLEGWIDLSPAMRQLMERTLHEDIEQIEQGLRSGDGTLVQQRLHSLNGGLATVRATALSMACGQWEAALEQGPLDARASAGIKVLLERLRVVAMALREEPRA